MVCPKCGNEHVNVQMVNSKINSRNTSIFYKFCRLILICSTFGLWLLVPSKSGNSKIKSKKVAVCQDCGHNWNL